MDFGLVVNTTPADWEPYLKVNLYGVMYCTRAALPGMVEGGWGRVVTVISDTARVGEPSMAAYSAAKAGAAGFCRSVAREVGRHGITVNCVALGTMRQPDALPDDELTEEQAAQLQKGLSRYIVRRRGTPDDVGRARHLPRQPAGIVDHRSDLPPERRLLALALIPNWPGLPST